MTGAAAVRRYPVLLRRLHRIARYWLAPVFPVPRSIAAAGGFVRYLAEWRRYGRMAGAEPLKLEESYPCLFDRTATTPFAGGTHYFYQAIWAAERIAAAAPSRHVDVGSDVQFVGMLAATTPVAFVDVRPLRKSGVPRLSPLAGDLERLPFAGRSVGSLSCLHVAEHVGLGRYGDWLNPHGTRRACEELARVLAPGGELYFSLPVGRPRVNFNAHRVHAPQSIPDYFPGLELVEFSVVDDAGNYRVGVTPEVAAGAEYACGLYRLVRPAEQLEGRAG